MNTEGSHFHKCGFGIDADGRTQTGCGYIWQHNAKDFDWDDSALAHTCPRCGKKGQSAKYNEFNCRLAGESYEHPDPGACATWPAIPSVDQQRTSRPTDAIARLLYEELLQDIERSYLCMVRTVGKRRDF